jgi:hypothetical protein
MAPAGKGSRSNDEQQSTCNHQSSQATSEKLIAGQLAQLYSTGTLAVTLLLPVLPGIHHQYAEAAYISNLDSLMEGM